jgi:hypothetical protein
MLDRGTFVCHVFTWMKPLEALQVGEDGRIRTGSRLHALAKVRGLHGVVVVPPFQRLQVELESIKKSFERNLRLGN